ncbi:MAG: FHA domain-containing protein [Xenococcaceae cyanobacterium]
MITLTLLHPLQPVPVQSWTFNNESKISIGRSTSNEVVLYSAVVSRHHVEIRKTADEWELVNLGANGTYIDGKRITKTMIVDGMVMRLASSGPKILIKLEPASEPEHNNQDEDKVSSTRQLRDSKSTLIN